MATDDFSIDSIFNGSPSNGDPQDPTPKKGYQPPPGGEQAFQDALNRRPNGQPTPDFSGNGGVDTNFNNLIQGAYSKGNTGGPPPTNPWGPAPVYNGFVPKGPFGGGGDQPQTPIDPVRQPSTPPVGLPVPNDQPQYQRDPLPLPGGGWGFPGGGGDQPQAPSDPVKSFPPTPSGGGGQGGGYDNGGRPAVDPIPLPGGGWGFPGGGGGIGPSSVGVIPGRLNGGGGGQGGGFGGDPSDPSPHSLGGGPGFGKGPGFNPNDPNLLQGDLNQWGSHGAPGQPGQVQGSVHSMDPGLPGQVSSPREQQFLATMAQKQAEFNASAHSPQEQQAFDSQMNNWRQSFTQGGGDPRMQGGPGGIRDANPFNTLGPNGPVIKPNPSDPSGYPSGSGQPGSLGAYGRWPGQGGGFNPQDPMLGQGDMNPGRGGYGNPYGPQGFGGGQGGGFGGDPRMLGGGYGSPWGGQPQPQGGGFDYTQGRLAGFGPPQPGYGGGQPDPFGWGSPYSRSHGGPLGVATTWAQMHPGGSDPWGQPQGYGGGYGPQGYGNPYGGYGPQGFGGYGPQGYGNPYGGGGNPWGQPQESPGQEQWESQQYQQWQQQHQPVNPLGIRNPDGSGDAGPAQLPGGGPQPAPAPSTPPAGIPVQPAAPPTPQPQPIGSGPVLPANPPDPTPQPVGAGSTPPVGIPTPPPTPIGGGPVGGDLVGMPTPKSGDNGGLPDFMNPANLPPGIQAFGTPNGQGPVAPSAQAMNQMSPTDKGTLDSYWQDIKGVSSDDMNKEVQDLAPKTGAAVPTGFQ